MKSYPVHTSVTVSFPLADSEGSTIASTGLSLKVYNEDGMEVYCVPSVPFAAGDTDVEVTIPDSVNALTVAAVGVRVCELTIDAVGESSIQSFSYLIKARSQLILMKNTFMTMERALMTAALLPNLNDWESAADDEREISLMASYDRLTTFSYRFGSLLTDQSRLYTGNIFNIGPSNWAIMTTGDFAHLPQRFQDAIRKAQVAEASEILKGVDPNDKRRSGVLSESIGESSMMFRVGKPLDMGLSFATLGYLKGYIDNTIQIGRS